MPRRCPRSSVAERTAATTRSKRKVAAVIRAATCDDGSIGDAELRHAARRAAEEVTLGGAHASPRGRLRHLWRSTPSWRGRARGARWVATPSAEDMRSRLSRPPGLAAAATLRASAGALPGWQARRVEGGYPAFFVDTGPTELERLEDGRGVEGLRSRFERVSGKLPGMAADSASRPITSRVLRTGESGGEGDESGSTPAERIEAVWEITLQCLEWRNEPGEPRLQRSVSRVQRPGR